MESAGLKGERSSLAWLAAIAAIAVITRVVVIGAGWPAFIDPDGYLSIAAAMLRAEGVTAFVATLPCPRRSGAHRAGLSGACPAVAFMAIIFFWPGSRRARRGR